MSLTPYRSETLMALKDGPQRLADITKETGRTSQHANEALAFESRNGLVRRKRSRWKLTPEGRRTLGLPQAGEVQ